MRLTALRWSPSEELYALGYDISDGERVSFLITSKIAEVIWEEGSTSYLGHDGELYTKHSDLSVLVWGLTVVKGGIPRWINPESFIETLFQFSHGEIIFNDIPDDAQVHFNFVESQSGEYGVSVIVYQDGEIHEYYYTSQEIQRLYSEYTDVAQMGNIMEPKMLGPVGRDIYCGVIPLSVVVSLCFLLIILSRNSRSRYVR